MRIVKTGSAPMGGRTCGVKASVAEITALLGFAPRDPSKQRGSDGKVDAEWSFLANGLHCAVWRFKGASVLSFGGDYAVALEIFGEKVVG